jgi:hypothetical protein
MIETNSNIKPAELEVFGERNKTGLSLQKITGGSDFTKLSLKGKHANIYDDLSSKDINDGGSFKIATGGGFISAEEKFGDCVQFISGITGEPVFGKLATNAVPMARMLSKNLLGDDRIYKGFYNGVATKVGKYFVGATGLTEALAKNRFDIVTGYSELTTTFPIMPNAKMAKMKLITDKKSLKILGGQVVSEIPVTDKVDIITLAIQADLTVKDLTSLSYSAQPYQSFFPANNLVVACAEEILVKLKNKLKEDKCCAL